MKPNPVHSFVIDMLRLWLPTMLIVGGFFAYLYWQEREYQIERIEAAHDSRISESLSILRHRLAASVRDLRYLASSRQVEEFQAEQRSARAVPSASSQRMALADEWRRFMDTRADLYDQIRYIDRDGRELVRINNDDGKAVMVGDADLQPKLDRYYVQDARRLAGGETYLSRLDLNVEHGAVERPLKPMLRLVTAPMQGRAGDGSLLVLNFMAKSMLERLRGNSDGQLWLLDPQGYWLLGDDPGREWGSMLPERRDRRLDLLYPQLQAALRAAPASGTLTHRHVAGGVFSYRRYVPGADTSRLLPDVAVRDASDDAWTVARWTPSAEVQARMSHYLRLLIAAGGALTLLVTLGTAYVVWLGRRRLEAVAAEQETAATLERFIDASPDALVVSDAQGRIVRVNRLAEQWLGYEPGELAGQPIEVLLPERLRAPHPGLRRQYLARPVSRPMGEGSSVTARRKDGSEFPVSISLNTIGSPGGADLRVISALRDISVQLEAEQNLRESNARIRAAVLASEQANRQLSEANHELEAFSYSVSHDLRAPLRSLDGFSSMLLKSYADKLDAAGQDYLQRIRAASVRMAQMIDDILLLSRIGRGECAREPVDLSAMAAEVVRELRAAAPERQVEVRIAPGLSAVADPGLLRIALDNLIGNAWKYTGKTEAPRIEFGSERHDGELEFFVRDNGAGFDMAYADKLFGAFQRLHQPGDFPGSGIGLATVLRVIRKHGGHIRAEAAVGQGATFRFTLGGAAAEAGDA